jgi:hypothetical protein
LGKTLSADRQAIGFVPRERRCRNNMASMYCVKCRAKRDVANPEKVTMKNGKPAMKAKCPVCGTGMYRIGSA